MMRLFLFLATNAAILLVVSLIFNIFGLQGALDAQGVHLNLQGLLLMSAVIGMTGSFISLATSKWSAKRAMGVFVIEAPSNGTEQWLLDTVRSQAAAAGIGMPEVGIFDAAEPNAFATGMSRDSALVAVSTGLLHNMDQDEVAAVIGHELTHVANGDMVTMALMQGVVNTFVYFFATVIGYVVDRAVFKTERGYGPAYYVTQMVAQLALGVLASILVMWFSRRREFRADAGGARLAGTHKMIAALQALQRAHEAPALPEQLAAFGITGGGFSRLFMSHPPLEERIAALRNSQ
ncbi:protease HtpX [Methylovulum psychrotolerans]|uniref:Protease HtpX n=1 Tax=Methylovulum psychrotolerans TaxID=1704499 RepID=A0A2S5CMD1_9GAMM|nr:protease HtpX [Methylovulum psychrotolerans]MBT9096727.1 protease HtpX [Methylovulum psychrotolerans]POZ51936.1 protease HtpX [Methylovulum psychrotolerans]